MGSLESEGKKFVIAGISIRTSLKQINTKPRAIESKDCEEESLSSSTTPTAKEARIPEILTCPPTPRKLRSSSRCNFKCAGEFFIPPDLETVFIHHCEKAN